MDTQLSVSLRNATEVDIPLLRYWDKQPHIIESDPNDDWDWENQLRRTLDWREQLIAEVAGRPVGFIEIIVPDQDDEHYWGDCEPNLRAIDIWIGEESDLGQGIGTKMMNLALKRCFDDPSTTAVLVDPLDSNVRAQRFYGRFGFHIIERRWFGLDYCTVMRLERRDWTLE